MIALLTGQPLLHRESLIIQVGGVGYGVSVGGKTMTWAKQQSQVTLFIYTHVREDMLELFGFADAHDKELFQLLLSVSGVGPKTALNIVDYGGQKIVEAVQKADVSLFSSVPRVGKKLSQKIIIELKSKLGSIQELYLGPQNQHEKDVVDALSALGFSDADVQKAVQKLDFTTDVETSQRIKEAIALAAGH